jgi:hypothetical protein
VVVAVVAQASSSLIGSRVGRRRASNIDWQRLMLWVE